MIIDHAIDHAVGLAFSGPKKSKSGRTNGSEKTQIRTYKLPFPHRIWLKSFIGVKNRIH
jgi:hypothetical protein